LVFHDAYTYNAEVEYVSEDKKRITLPKNLQVEIMKFFLKTSIPKIKKEKESRLSKSNDRGDS